MVTDASAPVVLPLRALGASSLGMAGGKAANLGILLQAGLPVPDGFCITTAAYASIATADDLVHVVEQLGGIPPDDVERLTTLAGEARRLILASPIPSHVAEAIGAAYRDLDGDPAGARVAVRSSATAEDLPSASFAGQQDTYLNIVGQEALLDAVRRCWASLWTDRAVSYRAANGIDPTTVRLAVVVQRMVPAGVAGVLFTANPLTGQRAQMVVDASPGLGEAVVSGAVNPDHWVLDGRTGIPIETRLGDKRLVVRASEDGGTERVTLEDGSGAACLSPEQLQELAALGRRVQAVFGAPQDTEFAFDVDGRCWLVQARPITTLYPLPANAPAPGEGPRVYFSVNVVQGVFRPITPMGVQAIRLVAGSLATGFGRPPSDRYAGPATVVEAGQRVFLDVTPILRHRLGRRIFLNAMRFGEARTPALVAALADDPRLSTGGSVLPLIAQVLRIAVKQGVPARVARALARPAAARAAALQTAHRVVAMAEAPTAADAASQLAQVERVFMVGPGRLIFDTMPLVLVGLLSRGLAGRLLGERATDEELEQVVRALPHNPTTEMDLDLWALAEWLRPDEPSHQALATRTPAGLARAYRQGALPAALQAGLTRFLAAWGHRGVAEIDLGLPRWSDDPTHILGVLANYLRLEDRSRAPDVQFAEAAALAERTIDTLARRTGGIRGRLVKALLTRTRELAGLREWPKYYIIRISAPARVRLLRVGAQLVDTGRLESADDVFFVTLPEVRAGLAGTDLRSPVARRREAYSLEVGRRHVPRLLLSDGTEPAPPADTAGADDGALRGTPASSGAIRGRARVILDPVGAHLQPGEILVAPSTDPGWTPLFLTAAGLVMEMGGSMSHGSVVAREYGIPAVVGVESASVRIQTGQLIEVDGGRGLVRIVDESTPSQLSG
jgi:pyruvate,water dikinase